MKSYGWFIKFLPSLLLFSFSSAVFLLPALDLFDWTGGWSSGLCLLPEGKLGVLFMSHLQRRQNTLEVNYIKLSSQSAVSYVWQETQQPVGYKEIWLYLTHLNVPRSLFLFCLYPSSAKRGAKTTPEPDNDWELCPTRQGDDYSCSGQTTTRCMDYILLYMENDITFSRQARFREY